MLTYTAEGRTSGPVANSDCDPEINPEPEVELRSDPGDDGDLEREVAQLLEHIPGNPKPGSAGPSPALSQPQGIPPPQSGTQPTIHYVCKQASSEGRETEDAKTEINQQPSENRR